MDEVRHSFPLTHDVWSCPCSCTISQIRLCSKMSVTLSTPLYHLVSKSLCQDSNRFLRRDRSEYYSRRCRVSHIRQQYLHELDHWTVGLSYGSRIRANASTQEREWQEYDDARADQDLERALELLDVLNTFESDTLDASAELVPLPVADDKARSTSGQRTPETFEILDVCQRNSDLVRKAYDWLVTRDVLPSFGKFKTRAWEGERLVTEAVLVDSIGLGASNLSPKKWGLTGDTAILLTIGFALFSYLLDTGTEVRPLAALVLALGIYDAIYWGGTGLGQIRSMWLPYKRRILVHEAGHVLVAYLLGCPVRGVILDPVQAINLGIQGQAGTLFWDETLEKELSQDQLSGATVDRYSIILFAGIAAEAVIYGEAEGGESDENLFKSVVSQLDPPWSPAKMSNQARWAVLQAFKLIKENIKAHAAVVEALEEGDSLGSMIRAMEEAMV